MRAQGVGKGGGWHTYKETQTYYFNNNREKNDNLISKESIILFSNQSYFRQSWLKSAI